jgi:hypothetical protein
MSQERGVSYLVALDLGLTVVYDFVDLSCDIATAPLPSADTDKSARTAERRGKRTHETSCPSFKFSLIMTIKVGVEAQNVGDGSRGVWACFIEA